MAAGAVAAQEAEPAAVAASVESDAKTADSGAPAPEGSPLPPSQPATTPAEHGTATPTASGDVAASVDQEELAGEVRAGLVGQAVDPSTLEPPEPDEEAFDWVRFDSGEWLGGDLKEMRDRRVSFDSDKFDGIAEDWDDVVEFRSSRTYTYVNADLDYFEGPGLVTKDTVSVRTKNGIESFPRSELLSIVAIQNRELDRWSLKFSLAATARAGNSNTVDLNNYAFLRRQDKLTRAKLESTTNLGNVAGARTVQNWNGVLQGDVFFHRVFYATPIYAAGQHNYFQNLAFRGVLGGGVGAHAVDKSWLSVDFEALGAYQYTEALSVTAPDALTADDAVIGLGTSIEWDITGDIDLDLDWKTSLVVTQMSRTYHNGSARFSLEVTDILDFDLTAALYRIEEPPQDDTGATPLSDDWTFTAGLGIELN
jgi:hypothetical protein